METEVNKKLPFLDVLITSCENDNTTLYRKITFTGLFTNFNSFTPMHYKLGLLKSLIHRAFEISSDWLIFHSEVLNINRFYLTYLALRNVKPGHFYLLPLSIFKTYNPSYELNCG